MSVSRPLRCLFAKPPTSIPCIRQSFHTSRPRLAREPKYPSIKASELGLLKVQNPSTETNRKPRNELKKKRDDERHPVKSFEPYSEEDWKSLAQIYTPEQLKAIEAGEAAIPTDDLFRQGALREDSFALPYVDDLSYIHPVVDKPIRAPKSNYDPNWRFKETDELLDDVVDWAKKLPDDPDRLDWLKFRDNVRLTVGKEEAERNPRSYLAPELPRIDSLPRTSEKDDIDPAMRRLMLQTGYTLDQIKRFRIKVLVMHRVVNQTRMGKIQSLYFLAVAGNGRGLLGIGEGKSAEAMDAKKQASMAAVRNMVPIPRYEDRTIYGDVKGKVGATEVEVMTRPPGKTKHTSSLNRCTKPPQIEINPLKLCSSVGFGLRCQSYIYEMSRCAGLHDLAARVTRSRNPMNTVKATLQALVSQRLPEHEARALGRKLVDVRKVYYDGNV